MSRLVTSGFEIYAGSSPSTDTDANDGGPDGNTRSGFPAVARITSDKRSGNACLEIGPNTIGGDRVRFLPATALERGHWLRVYVKVIALPSASSVALISFFSGVNVNFDKATGGIYSLYAVGTKSSSINDGAWHRVEVYEKCSATQANRAWELRLDGTTVSSGTAQASGGVVPTPFTLGDSLGDTLSRIRFDDLAVNDDQGSSQNTWPGAGYVICLKPTSDNSRGSWTGGAGGTTSLFDALNNTPPLGAIAPGTNLQQIRANAVATTGVFDTESFLAAGATAGDTAVLAFVVACHGEEVTTGTKSGSANSQTTNNVPSTTTGTFAYGLDVGAEDAWPLFWRWSKAPATAFSAQPTLSSGARLQIITTTTSRVASCCFLGLIVELAPPAAPTTWTGAATVSLTDTRTSAGTRKTFAVAVISEADIRQTGGTRTTTSVASVALVTNLSTAGVVTAGAKLGSATVALVASRTTAGIRTARTASSVALTNSRTTAGARTTTSAAAVALVASRTTVGRRTTLSTATVSLVASRTTTSRLTVKAATATGELVHITTTAALAGDKIGTTTTTLNLAITTSGRRTTTSQTSTNQAVTVTTLGRRTRLAAVAVSETIARTSTGRVGVCSSSTIPVAVSVITSTRKVWFSTSTAALAATITTRGARLQYGTATLGETVQISVGSASQLADGASVQLTASVFSSATSLSPLPPAPISQTEDGLFALTSSGSYSHTGSGNINDHQEGTLVGTTTGRIIG
jgi:hypothetical protein